MNLIIISLSHFLHLLATIVWIGGIVMILSVILPGAKSSLVSAMASRLMNEVTKRFTPMANISILILIVTGVIIAIYDKNYTGFSDFSNNWIVVLLIKHFIVALMIAIHFYRGLILNPMIARLSTQTSEPSSKIPSLQKFSLNLVKANLFLGLVVLLLTGLLSSL